jgi:hypothetical protein
VLDHVLTSYRNEQVPPPDAPRLLPRRGGRASGAAAAAGRGRSAAAGPCVAGTAGERGAGACAVGMGLPPGVVIYVSGTIPVCLRTWWGMGGCRLRVGLKSSPSGPAIHGFARRATATGRSAPPPRDGPGCSAVSRGVPKGCKRDSPSLITDQSPIGSATRPNGRSTPTIQNRRPSYQNTATCR